jgi:deoxycytidylate deaminase
MTCAKRQVECVITTAEPGPRMWFRGRNDCERPQTICPREPGEDYTKCKTICRQGDHAELAALKSAREAGADLYGSTATVFGHYWICEPCGAALRDAGVKRVVVELETP